MVGYQQDDTMTSTQKLIVGCVSGAVTRFVTQPLDVIKLRTQVQKDVRNPKNRWFNVTRKILKDEGITAFWHGHNLGQIHSILAVSSQFYAFELATKYVAIHPIEHKYKPYLIFFCGTFAGCASATLVLPIELIRVRQMLVKEQYRSLIKGAQAVYKAGGILAFYEGLPASLLQMGPAVGISFTVFNLVQALVLSYMPDAEDAKTKPLHVHKPEYLLIASTIAGSIAGFASKSITYPFDLVKRRMQIAGHQSDSRYKTPKMAKNLIKCTRLVECLVNTVKHEGLQGLFRGWKVTLYKAQLTSVVAFTSYELLCQGVREMNSSI